MYRKNFLLLAGIFLLVLFAVIVGYYVQTNRTNTIITLVPDEGETKKKPEDPGGLVIPNSDSLVYEKLQPCNQKNRKINIIPGPEEPDLIVKNIDNSVMFVDSIDEILSGHDYEDLQANNKSANDISDNTDIDEQEDKNKKIIIPGVDLNIVKSNNTRFNLSNNAIVKNADAGYKIQLSVAFSENDALLRWQGITKRHNKILENANLITRKVEGQNERIFYIILAGTYTSLNQAKLVCKKLISRKQNCIVTK
jgi:hypothetical protein